MADNVWKSKEIDDIEMSPLAQRLMFLFGYMSKVTSGDHAGSMKLLPRIFDVPQEELDKALKELESLDLISVNRPN